MVTWLVCCTKPPDKRSTSGLQHRRTIMNGLQEENQPFRAHTQRDIPETLNIVVIVSNAGARLDDLA
jgi:hypothetical protein